MARLLIALAVFMSVTGCAAGESGRGASDVASKRVVHTAQTPGRAASGVAHSLAGDWIPVTLNGHDIPALPNARAVVRFNGNGSVGARNGCNLYLGSFAIDGANVRVKWESITREACLNRRAGGALASDMRRVPNPAVLSQARTFLVDHDRLKFVGADGSVVGIYRRSP